MAKRRLPVLTPRIAASILHNARIYRYALVKRIWLALCSQVT